MTLPNGPAGLVPNIEFGVGFGDLSGLVGRNQNVVTEILAAEVQLSTAWNYATSVLFEGLERGIPFVLALIQGLIHRLFNTAEQFPGVGEALAFIEEVPGVRDLVNTLTGADGGLVELGNFVSSRWSEIDWLVSQLVAFLQAAGKVALGDVGTAIANAETNLQKLVSGAVGSGGSGFPWTFPVSFGTGSGFPWSFPVSFGDVEKSVTDVGAAILNAPQTGQQVLNQLVQSISGVQSTIDHSLMDLHTVVQQLPGSPPLATVAVGVQQAATAAGQIGALVTNSLQADAASAGAFLATAGSNASGAVGQLNDAAVNAIGGAQAAAGQFGQALAGAFGGWFNAFTGAGVLTATPADVAAVMTSTAATVSNNTQNLGGMTGLTVASVNQALAKSGVGIGGSGGTNVTVNFSSYANALNLSAAGFSGAVGYIGINGGQAAWVAASGTNPVFETAYYTTPTVSDYQVASMVLGAANNIAYSAGACSSHLLGRCNSAMNTYAYLRLGGGGATLGFVIAGSDSGFGWFISHTPIIGAVYELICGDEATSNLYSYKVLCNGTQIGSTYADSGHVSQVGSSYRYAGLAMFDSVPPGSGNYPASVSSWGVADNAPPAVIGSGFRAYCSRTSPGSGVTPSPSTISVGGATLNILKFPASCFDTTQWLTSDYTYNSSTNTLTVNNNSWLTVSISTAIATSASDFTGVGYFHNGTWQQCGQGTSWATGVTTIIRDKFDVYCAAGDTLTPGLYYVGGFSFSGDANGYSTSWGVAMTNVGTLS